MLRKLIKLLSWWLLLKLSSYLLTPNSFQSLSLSLHIYIYICCFTHLHSCLQSFSESTVFSRMILNLPTLEPRGDNCSFFALQALSESIADFSWMIFNLGWSPSTAIEFVFVFCFFFLFFTVGTLKNFFLCCIWYMKGIINNTITKQSHTNRTILAIRITTNYFFLSLLEV